MTPAEFWAAPGPFTVDELVAVTRLSEGTVRKAIEAKALRVVRVGRLVRIPASAARKYAREVGCEPPDLAHQAHGDAPAAPPDVTPSLRNRPAV